MRLLDPLVHEPGAIGAEKVMAQVGELIGDARIEDLPIPMAGFQPDLLIEVPVDACGTLEFDRAEEMIEVGRARAEEALARSGLGR